MIFFYSSKHHEDGGGKFVHIDIYLSFFFYYNIVIFDCPLFVSRLEGGKLILEMWLFDSLMGKFINLMGWITCWTVGFSDCQICEITSKSITLSKVYIFKIRIQLLPKNRDKFIFLQCYPKGLYIWIGKNENLKLDDNFNRHSPSFNHLFLYFIFI